MNIPSNTPTFKQLIQYPGLLAAIFGRTFSSLALQTLSVAMGWQIYDLTHSAAALGFVGLAMFFPLLILVLPAGHMSDRFNRKNIVVICLIIEALCAIILAWQSFHNKLTPTLMYIILILFGCARSFEMPCQKTFLVNIVPTNYFPQATALSSSLFQTASILGPAVGGILYGFGADLTYIVCTVSFLLAAIATFTIQFKPTQKTPMPLSIENLFGGIRFIFSRPRVLGAISLDLFAVLLGGATAMLPIYAKDILHCGPVGLGILKGSSAIGALLIATYLTKYPIQRNAGKKMFVAVFIFGIATIIFGLSTNLTLSVICLAALGGADVISVVVRSTLIQLLTPNDMLGRVSAVNMVFIGSSNQLGEFESGMLAEVVGPVNSVVIGGIGTIIIACLWIALFPSLRKVDRLDNLKSD
ncbi:MFS transporter [Commensalibacter papalotli (ex Botero et al. 2024)]|uniref:MFS family (AraJ) (PDB:4LDS) n=1 Tax=Commensalibacter papalotli (ex Botero et al. 2024) TaxID=2972766 RepID=A0ABM9HSK3_9PROT|nr:MFS transporter [Commensalibacter papalotli (ex Botero et al. 2024)]CAI3940139.1 MFS family (AraJ) (PDB:4LDS) [Commensalibacter papalotli (ex Botero et al. 2024)]CAI3950894.1 MFS family (AraJ) (PDB:4LDS) [Commensalibacter papalotli (ex Botero et al. 2024)]